MLLGVVAALPAAAQTAPVMMLSDIHFDPFRDPGRFTQLAAAPAERWEAILSAPAAAAQQSALDKLLAACPARGVDTDWPLFAASLQAERARMPHPAFITVSGDLMAHQFECRYRALGGKPEAYAAFAAKTVAFVAGRLRQSFPGVPLYIALGNNDSGCGDYREDPESVFLQRSAASLGELTGRQAAQVRHEASRLGDWSVELPAPFSHARLIVLQDIFASSHYKTCANEDDSTAAAEQNNWLRDQLQKARKQKQNVWVMAHVPPGVDLYATVAHARDVCAGQQPILFESSSAMEQTLEAFHDVIRLGVFGHTHMDEIRVIGQSPQTVVIKVVPSISPINGNLPSFTVAQVETATATLKDYAVYAAANPEGSGRWEQEYRFSESFHQPEFTAATAEPLLKGFLEDKESKSPETLAYQQHFFSGPGGKHALLLRLAWPQYVCSVRYPEQDEFRRCACGAEAKSKSKSK